MHVCRNSCAPTLSVHSNRIAYLCNTVHELPFLLGLRKAAGGDLVYHFIAENTVIGLDGVGHVNSVPERLRAIMSEEQFLEIASVETLVQNYDVFITTNPYKLRQELARATFRVAHTDAFQHFLQLCASSKTRKHVVVLGHGLPKPLEWDLRASKLFEAFNTLDIRSLTVHNYWTRKDYYVKFDSLVTEGGSFDNPAPYNERPIVLFTFTHDYTNFKKAVPVEWQNVLLLLKGTMDLHASMHPRNMDATLLADLEAHGVTVEPLSGESYKLYASANCIVADMSGSLYEALPFNTPVLLMQPPEESKLFGDPYFSSIREQIPIITPEIAIQAIRDCVKQRRTNNKELAERYFGKVDGHAAERLTQQIMQFEL